MPLTFGQALAEMSGDPVPEETADADDRVLTLPRGKAAAWEEPAGGSQPGVARVLGPFPFAYNTANIRNGVQVYTPTVADVLLDMFVVIETIFDGTTPLLDIGTFDQSTSGVWAANIGQAIPLDNLDNPESVLSCVNLGHRFSDYAVGTTIAMPTSFNDGLYQVLGTDVNISATISHDGNRYVPATFATTTPIKVVISQDGTAGGTAVGGTAGAVGVYLIVASPSLT